MMLRGQVDRVTAKSSNGYVKLSCGMWISQDMVKLSDERVPVGNVFKNGEYRAGTDHDMIVWQSDVFAAVYARFDGKVLKVNFGMHSEAPGFAHRDDFSGTIFENIETGMSGDTPFYALTIKDGVKLEGCYIEYADGEFRFIMKKRKTLSEGDKPLDGISVVLDPGHGGTEQGAIGFMGADLLEKHLTLINSLKLAERLTALGADVHLTRDTDVSISLQNRVDLSWTVKPDLFISLHINSISETTNSANVRGFTVWYRNAGSKSFAQTILDNMYDINPKTNRNRNINQSNFFVCRPQWTPSVIMEASFIVNIDDFVWMIDPARQDEMADAAVSAVIKYFGS